MRARLIVGAWGLVLLTCGSDCAPRSRDTAPANGPSGAGPIGDPAADYAVALELQREGQHLRSVPYFHSASQRSPMVGGLHLDYGMALHNASIQTDASRGAVRYVVPTSQERARLRREALAEFRRAIELAPTSDERAYAWATMSRAQEVMGLPLDARECLEHALAERPSEPSLHADAARLDRRLHPPSLPATRGDGAAPPNRRRSVLGTRTPETP